MYFIIIEGISRKKGKCKVTLNAVDCAAAALTVIIVLLQAFGDMSLSSYISLSLSQDITEHNLLPPLPFISQKGVTSKF